MPARDNTALTNFELPRIDHGECMFAFIYDRPSFFATCHPFTKVARISYGKFDQLPLRFSRQVAAETWAASLRAAAESRLIARLTTKLSGKGKRARPLRMQRGVTGCRVRLQRLVRRHWRASA